MLAWRVDGELHGHSPAQTIGFVSDSMDVADRAADQRRSTQRAVVVSPDGLPPVRWWRRSRA